MLNLTINSSEEIMEFGYICKDCPRKCGITRNEASGDGFCGCPALPAVVRAAPHYGEEPCISGTKGSGAVFFSGCNLRCIFCQNYEISRSREGKSVTAPELRDILLRLQDQGVHNINLVTPTHFTRVIAAALEMAKLQIPVVWNSSGYELTETLKMLDGLVQIYMPDYKYADASLASKYSSAPDYPEVASSAIREMYRQRGAFVMDENGILRSGVLIRHLILPGSTENTMNAIDFVADTFPEGSVLFSLMSQYTPMPGAAKYPELTHPLDEETSASLQHYMRMRHIETGYWQDVTAATGEMIPSFDLTGV